MKTICWLEDVWRKDLPNIEKLQEARPVRPERRTLCFNNPNYRNFLLGLVEDYTRSYDIDGIMWGSERQGAFANALGASHGGPADDPARVTCFCQFCETQGEGSGASIRSAHGRASSALEKFVRAAAQRQAAGGRLLRDVLAAAAALSGDCWPGRCSGTTACAKPTRRSTRR